MHPNLKTKVLITDLALSTVLLEDNSHYPWIFLVPRRPNISRIMDLNKEDQLLLLEEMDLAQRVLWEAFQPDQINVAAIGNKTPQLHVHIIARFANDPAWPGTVWDHPTKTAYSEEELVRVTELLQQKFS